MKRENIAGMFVDSANGLKSTRPLVMAGMLLAIQVVLGLVTAIPIGNSIRISFGYVALSLTGMLLGPVASMINGALADILGNLIHPIGSYFPGFTITGIVSGLIYGCMLYRQDISLKRILITKLIIDVVCNLLLNTIWLNMIVGKAFWVLLPPRALKNLLQYPVDIIILYPVLSQVKKRNLF